MATSEIDINIEDFVIRRRVGRELRQIRFNAGETIRSANTRNWERSTNWRVFTLMKWARQFGYRVRFELIGIPLGAGEAVDKLSELASFDSAEAEDRMHLLDLHHKLRQGRRASGLTKLQLSNRWGTTRFNVDRFEERSTSNFQLDFLQRAARALGGKLEVRIERVN